MKKSKGTRFRVPILALCVTSMLACTAMAATPPKLPVADKVVMVTGSNTKTRDPLTVNCVATDTGLPTGNCIEGQYFQGDGAFFQPSWLTTWGTDGTGYTGLGSWRTGASVGAGSECIGCHHGNPATSFDATTGIINNGQGGQYLTVGHKNMLRKAVPAQPWTDWKGTPLAGAFSWGTTNGATPTPGVTWPQYTPPGKQLYYLFGWISSPDVLYQGGGSTGSYQCARCHTTGYRFDSGVINGNNIAPEPTTFNGSTDTTYLSANYVAISNTNLVRKPGDGGTGSTSSWALSGIQCERCHGNDKQYDPSLYSVTEGKTTAAGTYTNTNGRVSHFNSAAAGDTLPPDFMLDPSALCTTTNATTCPGGPGSAKLYDSFRPLPLVAVNEKSTALCIECHRQEIDDATNTTSVAQLDGSSYALGNIYPTQLPGKTITETPTINIGNEGPVSDGGKCSDPTKATYALCVSPAYWKFAPSESHGANGAEAFLNSPHARYNGTFQETTQNSGDLSITMTGTYSSYFADWGEAPGSRTGALPNAAKNGGCAGCHDVHNTALNRSVDPTVLQHNYLGAPSPNADPRYTMQDVGPTATDGSVVNATNVFPAFSKQCIDCHASHDVKFNHPGATTNELNTPFANAGTDPNSPCIICHMAGASGTATYHYFRINPDPNYYTFGPASVYYGAGAGLKNQQPNTYPESGSSPNGPFANYPAVGMDVDLACGQCHVGGNGSQNTYSLVPTTVKTGTQPPVLTRAALAARAADMHLNQAVAPSFNPPSGGIPTGDTTVSIINNAPGTTVFYTIDGSTPTYPITGTTTQYSTPIALSAGLTVNAISATVPVIPGAANNTATNSLYTGPTPSISDTTDCYTEAFIGAGGYTPGTTTGFSKTGTCWPATVSLSLGNSLYPSPEATATYVAKSSVPLPAPTISPVGANLNYPATTHVTITDRVAGTTIYYTTDGSTPTISSTLYGGSILVNQTETIKAIAVKTGYSNSPVATSYAFTDKLPQPTFAVAATTTPKSVPPGSYSTSGVGVDVKPVDTDGSAVICYTTDGSTPTATTAGTCSHGSSVVPFTVGAGAPGTYEVQVLATQSNYTNSNTSIGYYVIKN